MADTAVAAPVKTEPSSNNAGQQQNQNNAPQQQNGQQQNNPGGGKQNRRGQGRGGRGGAGGGQNVNRNSFNNNRGQNSNQGGQGQGPNQNRNFQNKQQNQQNKGGHENNNGPAGNSGGGGNQSHNQHHHVASVNDVGERRPNFKKNEDHMILQKLSQFMGPTYELQPISQEEIKFSNRNRLYVGNLTNDVTENDLKELFSPYGEIAESFINKEKNFAFVKVDYRQNAEKAKRELDGFVRKGRNIRVRFAPNATCIKVMNLDPFVSNELLYRTFEVFGPVERANVIPDERGKSTGEGIVEFARKNSALAAIRFCEERCLFLTASLKPAIVIAHDLVDDSDGFSEKSIMNRKNNDFLKARELGPRFANKDSFEHEYGTRWKQLHEMYAKKKEALKRELQNDIDKLDAQGEYARYEHETEMLREQLRQREQDRDRQKMTWEMKERNADEQRTQQEEIMRRTNEDMQLKMNRQEEELMRRQQENTLFMQAQQLNTILDQQEQKNFGYTRRGDHQFNDNQDMDQNMGGGNNFNRQSRYNDNNNQQQQQQQHHNQQQQHFQQNHHHNQQQGGGNNGGNFHQGGGGGGQMRNMQRQWDRRDDQGQNTNFPNKRRRF